MQTNKQEEKQTQEFFLSKKHLKADHDPLLFNSIQVYQSPIKKHLGLFLDEKLHFQHHIKETLQKLDME